ncbi:MAG: hypothetical protein LBI64_07060 [Coriobacteriales bacterium]|jgi:hypothetical protein|nr:hypothetical protein [Coriobacteriales bacterium]
MSEHDDRILKKLADTYVERQGARLLDEQETLRQQNLRYATPRADRLVKDLTQSSRNDGTGAVAGTTPATTLGTGTHTHAGVRRRRLPFIVSAAAACLVLFIGVLAVLTNLSMFTSLSPDATQNPAADPSSTSLPPALSPEQDSWSELRPLGFRLPVQFSVARTDWDNGQSIYVLDNTLHDDVVLTIQQPFAPGGQNDWSAEMDYVIIDGTTIPAVIRDEYKLLQFENEGAIYTISCRDDLATLASLYRSMVDPENKV